VVQATVRTNDDDELAGALYAVVLRLSRLPVDKSVDKAGLAVLYETRRLGTFRPSELAAQMCLDLSTISRHLRSLEQLGMVQRTVDPDDARAQRVDITASGGAVLDSVLGDRAATIGGAIAHWSEGDRRSLRQMLCRLADDLSHLVEPCPHLATGDAARTPGQLTNAYVAKS
jgi:DNA-binding MarR family transcriptional regulator